MNTIALLALASTQAAIQGSVSYRERIAMPPNAVVVVSLDRFQGDRQENVAELRLPMQGKQVPLSFVLPGVSAKTGVRYGLRARIEADGQTRMETARHTWVTPGGKRLYPLNLVSAAKAPSFMDRTWTFIELDGRAVKSAQPPTLVLEKSGRVAGFTGVNRFGGDFEWKAPSLQIDPGPMTMMAGPPEQMALENEVIRILPLVNRVALFEGQLLLQRGDRVMARLR